MSAWTVLVPTGLIVVGGTFLLSGPAVAQNPPSPADRPASGEWVARDLDDQPSMAPVAEGGAGGPDPDPAPDPPPVSTDPAQGAGGQSGGGQSRSGADARPLADPPPPPRPAPQQPDAPEPDSGPAAEPAAPAPAGAAGQAQSPATGPVAGSQPQLPAEPADTRPSVETLSGQRPGSGPATPTVRPDADSDHEADPVEPADLHPLPTPLHPEEVPNTTIGAIAAGPGAQPPSVADLSTPLHPAAGPVSGAPAPAPAGGREAPQRDSEPLGHATPLHPVLPAEQFLRPQHRSAATAHTPLHPAAPSGDGGSQPPGEPPGASPLHPAG